MKKQILIEIIVVLLVIMFLYASFSKYADFQNFIYAMHNQPFPGWFENILVVVIPPVEIAISILLMIKKTRMIGLTGATVLMTFFTLYVGAVIANFFPYVPCSCGGILSRLDWSDHFIFNLFFLGLSLLGLYLNSYSKIFSKA